MSITLVKSLYVVPQLFRLCQNDQSYDRICDAYFELFNTYNQLLPRELPTAVFALRSFVDVQLVRIPNGLRQSPRFVGLACNVVLHSIENRQMDMCGSLIDALYDNLQYCQLLFSSQQGRLLIQSLKQLCQVKFKLGVDFHKEIAVCAAVVGRDDTWKHVFEQVRQGTDD